MGAWMSRVWFLMFPAREYKLVVVGLDNAGKTTTLYKLHLGEAVTAAPTIGSNVEEVVFKNLRFEVSQLPSLSPLSSLAPPSGPQSTDIRLGIRCAASLLRATVSAGSSDAVEPEARLSVRLPKIYALQVEGKGEILRLFFYLHPLMSNS